MINNKIINSKKENIHFALSRFAYSSQFIFIFPICVCQSPPSPAPSSISLSLSRCIYSFQPVCTNKQRAAFIHRLRSQRHRNSYSPCGGAFIPIHSIHSAMTSHIDRHRLDGWMEGGGWHSTLAFLHFTFAGFLLQRKTITQHID